MMSKKRKKDTPWPSTVPEHPKYCPQCQADRGVQSRIRVYHLNKENDALFMCSNDECPWPLMSHDPQEILGKSDLKAKIKHKKAKKSKSKIQATNSPHRNCPLDLQFFSIPNLLSPLHPSSSPLYKSPRITSEASSSSFLSNKSYLYPPSCSPRSHGLSPSPKKESSSHHSVVSKETSEILNTNLDFEFKSPSHPGSSPFYSSFNDFPKKNSKCTTMDKTSNFSTSASDFEFKSPFQPSNNALDTFDEPLKENNVELSTSSKCKSPIHGVHISADPTNDTDAVKVSNNSSKVMHQVENDCSSEQSETQNSSNVSSVASNESDSNSNIDVTSTECSPSTTNVVIPTPSNLNFNSLNISGCSSQSQIIHPSIIDNLTNHESTTKENIKDPKEQSSSSLVDIPPQLSPSSDRCVEDIPFDSDVSFPETGNLDDDSPSPLHEVSSSERMPKLKEKNPSLIPKNQELGSMTITVSRDCPESKNVLTTINRPINLSSPQNFTTVSSTNHNTINGSVCSSTNASTSVVASAQNSKDSNKIFITPRKLVKINKLPDDIIKSDVKKINLASLNKSTFNNSSKGLVKLNSLSNKVSMSLGQNIDFKVLSMPPPNLKEKVEKLKTTILNRNDTNNAEFGQLMKNASSDDQSQKFLQKIQESLKISDKCDEVVFHVSNSVECSNNLSISSLDVTTSPSGVKVMLCSESDAIEKYDLLNESPPITRTPNKRGRGKQPRKASKETMEPEDINNFLANKELISNFRYHLSIMMEGFSVPREWEGIDPVIAMLASKKQNPNFAHIDIDSMMQLYAKILHYENFINTTNEVPSTQSPKSPTSSSEKEPEVTSPVCNIKHEIIEEIESSPYSVVLSSVHPPADRSVEYVPERYHSSNGQKIGRGKHVITFDYDKSHFGPIYAETDEEVRAIVNLVQEKVAEIKCRKENRTLYSYSSGSVIAESLLPEDVLNYIRESFTVKGLKKNIIGRKTRNYQKRSEVIKIDKTTGELIYPAIRNPSSGLPSVKSEPLEDSFQQKEPVSASRLERNVFSKDIPKVSESSKSKENSHISKKIDFANEISDLLGKIDPKSEEPPQVISSSQRVTNLRPLLLKPNPNKRKRPIRKKNSEITPEEALGASSLYVRPNKQEKVMKLLAQKEKKDKLVEKKKTKIQSGVYKGFQCDLPQSKNNIKKDQQPIVSKIITKAVNKPEISKEEQDLMTELLQVAEEFDRRSHDQNISNTFNQINSNSLESVDMPNLDDLF